MLEIKDDMLIMVDDGELYGYVGEKENAELTIPNEVKYIRDNAFNRCRVEQHRNFQ